MKKIFLGFASLGLLVALALTAYAYYSNLHQDAPHLDFRVYLALCPSSIFLMLTERASLPTQVYIITVVAIVNGCLYGTGALLLRRFLV